MILLEVRCDRQGDRARGLRPCYSTAPRHGVCSTGLRDDDRDVGGGCGRDDDGRRPFV